MSSAPAEVVPLDRHTYEDPFLDMAATKLPKSFKKLLELCQIYAMTHPQISPIIWRLAEYAVTSFVFKGDDESIRIHKDIFEKLKMLEKVVEFGLDHYGYGNCFVTISFPFVRLYRCRACETDYQACEIDYMYTGGRFTAPCRKCRVDTEFKPIDQYVKDANGINVFRLEPQLITPKYNRVTGRYFYYYDMPPDLVRSIEVGDKDIIDSTPVEYLECVRLRRKMRLKRVFHFKRPTLSGRDMAWGFPLVLPALKDAYLNQVYKKADEAIALEHSVPLRVVYPQPSTQDPMQKLALGNFKAFMARNIRYWRQDKNAIITAPMPIGTTNIGGDASAYSTIQARMKVVDEIMGAMLVTRGFVMGGENWSSASISQRVMENSFLNYLRRLDGCLQWIRDEVAAYLGLPPCTVTMKPFKKVDDVQMLQLIINLAQQNRVSWEEALSRMDLDSREELEAIEKEASGYTKLMIQQLIAQNEATSRAIVAQTIAQDEAQGAQELLSGVSQQSSGIRAEIEGKATKDEFAAQQQEQGAEAAASDPQAQALQARAAKDQAEAQKQQALAKVREREAGGKPQPAQKDPRQQLVDVDMDAQIQFWAQELLGLEPREQRRVLSEMHRQNPELASAIVEVANQLESGSRKKGSGGKPAVRRSQNPRQMMAAMVEDAKNPEDLAGKLSMLDARQQGQVLDELRRANPQLFVRVMKALNKMNLESMGGGGNVVDMRPLPEKKPPQRQESPV